MRSAHAVLAAACLVATVVPAVAQETEFPIPRELRQPISFAWSGSLNGAVAALAAQLGYTEWTTMASGLPLPRPAPSVDVSINADGLSAADIVVLMNQQAASRAVVVLDLDKRFVQVVYYD